MAKSQTKSEKQEEQLPPAKEPAFRIVGCIYDSGTRYRSGDEKALAKALAAKKIDLAQALERLAALGAVKV